MRARYQALRYFVIPALFCCFVAIFLTTAGCQRVETLLEPTGVLGQHPLIDASLQGYSQGDLAGNFVLGTGGVNGRIHQGQNLTLEWQYKDSCTVITTLPFDRVQFYVINSGTETVEFKFSSIWLKSYGTAIKPPELISPNSLIHSDYKTAALLRVKQNTKDKLLAPLDMVAR